jgi:fatty acid desaturase
MTTTQTSASSRKGTDAPELPADGLAPSPYARRMVLDLWHICKFYLGLLATILVLLAWTTNLVAKPLATIFGGSVTLVGMGIAYVTYARTKQQGYVAVPITHGEEYLPGSLLAVLVADDVHNERRQVITARNVYAHPWNDFWYGGLNYQIEHHLFPSMPRNNLKKAQKVVKAFCQEHEISYYETSVARSYKEILSFLHGIGTPLRKQALHTQG